MSRSLRWAGLALVAFIWGSTWLAIKIGLEDLPPFLAAGTRFAVATGVLAALSWAGGIAFPRGARLHAGLLAIGVLTFIVNYGAVYWGEQYIPSGLAAVLFAVNPLLVLLLAHAALETERITVRKLVGVVVGLAGVALIFRADLSLVHPRAPIGAAVTLLAPLVAALCSVGIKKWGQELHPYTLTLLPMAYGTVGLLAIARATEDVAAARWTAGAALSTIYLAVFGSVIAFVVYYRLLKEVAVSKLALVSYAFPVVAVALGWLVLDERLTGGMLAGAGLVIVGIALATARRRRPPAGAPEAVTEEEGGGIAS